MKFLRVVIGLAVVAAACGGSGGSTTAAPTTAGGTTVAPTTTVATTAPPTTGDVTTTVAPTTTTGLPSDGHPNLPTLSWSAVYLPEGPLGTYLATTFTGEQVELEARVDRGVEWPGHDGVWDRISFGTEDDPDHAFIYLREVEPWVVEYGGADTVSPDQVLSETFPEPLLLDLRGLPAPLDRIETQITVDFGGDTRTFGITIEVQSLTVESLELPFGTVAEANRLDVGVGGEFMGGGDFVLPVPLWFDLEHGLLRWDNPPGFQRLELAG